MGRPRSRASLKNSSASERNYLQLGDHCAELRAGTCKLVEMVDARSAAWMSSSLRLHLEKIDEVLRDGADQES